MSSVDHRKHPRYPASLPAAFALGEVVASESLYLNNISEGGLSFTAMQELKVGTLVTMRLPLTDFTPRLMNSRKWFPRLCQR